MPKEGFKSITVKDHVYDRCLNYYIKHSAGLSYIGVSSFSGFMTWVWDMMMGDDYIRDRIKQKIRDRSETIINLFN